MKIAFLSGAYKNAGDFLIQDRSIALLQHCIPEIEIEKFMRNDISGKMDLLNTFDAIVIGGGPVYKQDINQVLPINEIIDSIKVPIMIIGGGWYGIYGGTYYTSRYELTNDSIRFLKKVDKDGFGLACRDIHSYKILKRYGFNNVFLTGCPAWYDIGKLELTEVKNKGEIKNICISDPANIRNYPLAKELIFVLKDKFPEATITFIFHRGIKEDKYTKAKTAKSNEDFLSFLQGENIAYKDISFGRSGFELYDSCDLHIGFRVHAHIYNLSKRNKSILIEEDGRGTGVNETLGIPSLIAYNDCFEPKNKYIRKAHNFLGNRCNVNFKNDLSSYIDMILSLEKQYYNNAFLLEQQYFKNMCGYINQLKEGKVILNNK